MKIHLLADYYINPRPERAQELDFCFIENINAEEFDYVHIFKSSPPLPIKNIPSKVILNESVGRLTYKHYIEYANKNIPEGDIVILCNADIFFDSSILKVKDINLSNKVLALTRFCPYHGHWVNESGNIIPYGNQSRSQDVWIWKSKLKTEKSNFDFTIGTAGCDNKVAYQFHIAGYQVWNPSFSIVCYHKHKERDDHADHYTKVPISWLPGPYLLPNSVTVEDIICDNYKNNIIIY